MAHGTRNASAISCDPLTHDVTVISSASPRDAANVSEIDPVPGTPGAPAKKSSQSRRPVNPAPAGSNDYYREWVKGNSVANLVKSKLSASAEGRRLKQLKAQEDERRSLLLLRRMSGDERDEYFDAIGESDPVYKRLRRGCQNDDVDMDEQL